MSGQDTVAEPSREGQARRLAEHLAMISDVGKIAMTTLEMEELLRGVVQAIRHGFGFYDVSIFLIDQEAKECVLLAQSGEYAEQQGYGYRQKLGVGMVGWVAEHGETLLANDVTKEPRRIVAFEGEAQCRSELVAPIRIHDRTIGVINVENKQPNAFVSRDVVAIETIADQLAQAMVNAQLLQRTRVLNEFHRCVLDAIPSGVCVADRQGRALSVNTQFCQMFGLDAPACLHRPVNELLPETVSRPMKLDELLPRVFGEGGHWRLPDIRDEEDGRVFNARLAKVELPEGPAALVVIDDVTQWRRAEDEAERHRAHLELVMRHSPIGLATVDPAGKISFWASANERLLGFAAAEAQGRMASEFFPDRARFDAALQRGLREGAAEEELTMRCKDGKERQVQVSVGPLMDREGRHIGFTLCVLDVTERSRAAAELSRERQKLNDVVSVIGAGLALVDRDHNVLWANTKLEGWFGRGRPVAGRKCYEVYCHRDRPCQNCVAQKVFEGQPHAETTETLHVGDGLLRHFSHTASPVKGQHGEVTQVLKLTQDITDQTKKVYQLSRVRQIAEVMQGVLELDRLLHFILTCVTAGQALGFNRSLLFLKDESRRFLEGRQGVGPASLEDARRIWARLGQEEQSLEELLSKYDTRGSAGDDAMTNLARSIRVDLMQEDHVAVQCVMQKRPILVRNAFQDPGSARDLAQRLGANEYVLSPLIARGETIGLIEADNLYSGRPIAADDVELLSMFASQAAIAITAAEAFRRVQQQMVELEQAYCELAEAQEKLLRSERLVTIGRMAAHVAHEIRNPLVTIGGFARAMIKSGALEAKTRRHADIIVEEVTRLEGILRGVMDFARPPAPTLAPHDVNAVVRRSLRLVKDRAAERNVTVDVKLDESLPEIWLDPTQLQQVFLNILSNAVDAINDGGVLTITSRKTDRIEVAIHNTGSFIPPSDQVNVFEPFVTRKEGGTGLGLSISQKIVQDHGGEIRLESSPEAGTTFTVMLPLDKPKNAAPSPG
ncbi:MAG TPA: PAS domain-containing protein [Candidatus Brocadiia bacterium]|nr:PAS domain-containing protein [Candidatus Brocadiia bacterium]